MASPAQTIMTDTNVTGRLVESEEGPAEKWLPPAKPLAIAAEMRKVALQKLTDSWRAAWH